MINSDLVANIFDRAKNKGTADQVMKAWADHVEYDLRDIQAEILEVNHANGWFESERPFDADIALLHTEVSEAYEAFREVGLELREVVDKNDNLKPDDVASELADVAIRLLDTCHRYGIDLGYEIDRKLKYNRTRGFRHGGKRV